MASIYSTSPVLLREIRFILDVLNAVKLKLSWKISSVDLPYKTLGPLIAYDPQRHSNHSDFEDQNRIALLQDTLDRSLLSCYREPQLWEESEGHFERSGGPALIPFSGWIQISPFRQWTGRWRGLWRAVRTNSSERNRLRTWHGTPAATSLPRFIQGRQLSLSVYAYRLSEFY